MKIKIVFEFDDFTRRAINNTYGDIGKADHRTCKAWIIGTVESTLEDVCADLERDEERDAYHEVDSEI